MDQPRQTVIGGALDPEVARGLPGTGEFGPYAGIIGGKRAIRQAGPVSPDRGVEVLSPAWRHVVIDFIDPFDVGTKAKTTAKIERHVDAQTALNWRRIDQPRKYIDACATEIVSLRQNKRRRSLGGIRGDDLRKRLSVQAGAIDEGVENHRARRRAAETDLPPLGAAVHPFDRRVQRQGAAAI